METTKKRVRYGVVGLGWFAQEAVLPAFAACGDNSVLMALFSGDADKREELSGRYDVPAYDYSEYEHVLGRDEIDAVYIVSPNSEHNDHALPAARHGVHVLSEKPLAESTAAAESMVRECQQAGVRLMTAYRLHFDQAHLEAIETVRAGLLGEPRIFSSVFTQCVEEGNTRLDADLGGSPLLDEGIYCINAARYFFGAEPIEVTAMGTRRPDPRFREVWESVAAILKFPGEKVAAFTCGFGQSKLNQCRVVGTEGDLFMEPAFSHNTRLDVYLTVGGNTKHIKYKAHDQVAAEIDYFSECILRGEEPEPDGIEGLIDVQIIDAIERSIAERRVIELPRLEKSRRPSLDQLRTKRAPRKPRLVKAAPPNE